MEVLGEQLESPGDELPTFDCTYEDYKRELKYLEEGGKKMAGYIRDLQ